jgi:3-dehydroquinate synthase
MPAVHIALEHHEYDVSIEPGSLEQLGTAVRSVAPHPRCALISDRTVGIHWGAQARASLEDAGYAVTLAELEPGEKHKTLATVSRLYDALLDERLERRSPVIALGGGVTGDTAGFVAATYLRGVPFIQCPTSLLAMVDSSVGGKVGVNVPQGKNLIGAFYQPHAVVIDPQVLRTLPARELRCGLAECIKHGVIRDPHLLDFIEEHSNALLALDPVALVELVRRNVEIKARVVMEDERESGVRAHLNFGHTFAHAIEATVGYGEILHGEAVGLGMLAAASLASRLGLCDASLGQRLADLLDRIGLMTRATLPRDELLMDAMRLDKKVVDERLRFVLPDRTGHVVIRDDIDPRDVRAAWSQIRA